MSDEIVIAGGGLAGQRCAETLRRQGYDGAIRIVCAELHRPYDRPALSKEVLSGERPEDSLLFRPAEWYEEQSIDLLLGVEAASLSVAERRVTLSDGTTLSYDQLLIATGSHPRVLPLLAGYDNVSVLRTLEDSRRLREVFRVGSRVAVLGAGFIGQEVAATARKLGAEVTMIEAGCCPLAGVLGQQLGEWFSQLHRAEGVDVITGATVERVDANGKLGALHLSNGRVINVEHVLVGIGVHPSTEWLESSGLNAAAGVRVDPHGRAAVESVLAAGDAAATFDPILGRYVTGSHWEAAGRQGARAARVMLGFEPGPAPLTSFWTDQYGTRIQYLGQARSTDAIGIDGDPESRNFTATFTRAGRPVAALLVDRPHLLPAARKMIENGGSTHAIHSQDR